MKLNRKIFLMPIAIAILLLTAQPAWAPVQWEITDGNPDYYMSDAIVVRNTSYAEFDLTAENPVGLEWQDPIVGQKNWVWVRVGRLGAFDVAGQTGHLRLFIGRAGTLFAAADYSEYDDALNPNILVPPDSLIWTSSEWDTNMTGKKVVPVRYRMNLTTMSMEYPLDSGTMFTPPQNGVRWLGFIIEPNRLPSTNSPEDLPFSLVAYIHDPLDDDGGDVTTNSNMAEGRFNIVEIDYGDAPDPTYPTLLVNDGARHLATGPMLGKLRDGELDGKPAEDADGDDTTNADDDDGIVFHNQPVSGTFVAVDVTASADGFLNAWVDFNLDGDWDDAGEQIFTDQVIAAGVNNLSFDVPATASATSAPYARFRIDSAGGLTPTGLAQDGEVEDYVVKEAEPANSEGGGSGGGGCFLMTILY